MPAAKRMTIDRRTYADIIERATTLAAIARADYTRAEPCTLRKPSANAFHRMKDIQNDNKGDAGSSVVQKVKFEFVFVRIRR